MKQFKFTYQNKGRAISENISALSKRLALVKFISQYPAWGTLNNLEIIKIR